MGSRGFSRYRSLTAYPIEYRETRHDARSESADAGLTAIVGVFTDVRSMAPLRLEAAHERALRVSTRRGALAVVHHGEIQAAMLRGTIREAGHTTMSSEVAAVTLGPIVQRKVNGKSRKTAEPLRAGGDMFCAQSDEWCEERERERGEYDEMSR